MPDNNDPPDMITPQELSCQIYNRVWAIFLAILFLFILLAWCTLLVSFNVARAMFLGLTLFVSAIWFSLTIMIFYYLDLWGLCWNIHPPSGRSFDFTETRPFRKYFWAWIASEPLIGGCTLMIKHATNASLREECQNTGERCYEVPTEGDIRSLKMAASILTIIGVAGFLWLAVEVILTYTGDRSVLRNTRRNQIRDESMQQPAALDEAEGPEAGLDSNHQLVLQNLNGQQDQQMNDALNWLCTNDLEEQPTSGV